MTAANSAPPAVPLALSSRSLSARAHASPLAPLAQRARAHAHQPTASGGALRRAHYDPPSFLNQLVAAEAMWPASRDAFASVAAAVRAVAIRGVRRAVVRQLVVGDVQIVVHDAGVGAGSRRAQTARTRKPARYKGFPISILKSAPRARGRAV